ncbi:MAG: N-acetyltransferase family protein [Sphingobacteriaceae bacterium]
MSLSIRPAQQQDIPTISRLAEEIWWPTYRDFISEEQISFMLKEMYAEEALAQQFAEGVTFLLALRTDIPVGFAGFSRNEEIEQVFKLHKLYVLTSEQGKGTGKALVDEVSTLAKANGGKILELNVNRGNKAAAFYKKQGFEIHQTLDIPYHQFVLNDYVMRKEL